MKKVLSVLLVLCTQINLIGCQLRTDNFSLPKKSRNGIAVSSGATGTAQESADPENTTREESSAKVLEPSPIPDMATFLERHNKAAEVLGSSPIDPAETEGLSCGESGDVEGGFLYDGSSDDYASGAVMFEPTYIRVTGRVSDQAESIKEYAAIAAGVTGAEPQAALEAMRGMVENMKPDTWTNGYKVNLGEVEFERILFSIEVGLENNITQFWVNQAGLNARLK